MKLRFTKMHGLGNDFVVVDARDGATRPWKDIAKKVLDRRFGVGADQLLVLNPSKTADVQMWVFERDGLQSEMCGNGIRCVARYLVEAGFPGREVRVETLAGLKTVRYASADRITVDMGKPVFLEEHWGETLDAGDFRVQIYPVSMGNPHAVVFVKTESDLDRVTSLGPKIENHAWFPERTNVQFVLPKSEHLLKVKVWERGAGETPACGTGACASAAVSIRLGRAKSPVTVAYRAGNLELEWSDGAPILMTGPAARVFDGEVEL